jgi:hypothetical protein
MLAELNCRRCHCKQIQKGRCACMVLLLLPHHGLIPVLVSSAGSKVMHHRMKIVNMHAQ